MSAHQHSRSAGYGARPSRGSKQNSRTALSETILGGLTAAMDVLVISGLGLLILALHPGTGEVALSRYIVAISICSVLIVQSFSISGLYRLESLVQPIRTIGKIFTTCIFVFGLLFVAAFALKVSADFSRIWTFSWAISTTASLIVLRILIRISVGRWAKNGALSRNIVVYGAGEHGARLVEHLQRLNQPWFRIIAVFDQRESRVTNPVGDYPVMNGLDNLVEFARLNPVDEIIISLPGNTQARIRNIIQQLASLPVDIRLCPEFIGTELMNRRVGDHCGIPMLNLVEKPVTGWPALSKVLFDYTFAALCVLLSLPLLMAIATSIKLESRGPILFRQYRYGFNNRLIGVYKFRTMYVDQTDQNAEVLTTRNDPRVTRIGAILRRFSLDELPQLLNVLKGEMSVVGPRPHALMAKAAGRLYEEVVDNYAARHKVKPGITGWAQVRGWRGNTDTEETLIARVEHDLHYIENWSLSFDLYIILLTVQAVISGENSY